MIGVAWLPSVAPPFPINKSINHSSIAEEVRQRGVTPRKDGSTTPPTPSLVTAAKVNVEVAVDLREAKIGVPCYPAAETVG